MGTLRARAWGGLLAQAPVDPFVESAAPAVPAADLGGSCPELREAGPSAGPAPLALPTTL